MKRTLGTVLLLAFSVAFAALADDARHKSTKVAQAAASPTEGEVRRVDREGKKITIRHGPIRNLDMPPMTMVFQVADPAMLDAVKPGDKVTFEADKVGTVYRVTRIVPVQSPR
ncbi:MAG: copper-binding protein [Burkholderiales bacterium]|nr:copper-binding protein [Burkholderiales bacterium]